LGLPRLPFLPVSAMVPVMVTDDTPDPPTRAAFDTWRTHGW
jgi:hypothetical protein